MAKNQLNKLLKNVLSEIKPDAKENYDEKVFAKGIIKRLKKTIKKEVVLTGSIAKGTFLRQKKDLDVFLLFSQKTHKEKFEDLVRDAVERAFPNKKYIISYAEHPYVRLHLDGRKIDIVPAYKIARAEDLKSAVDRSVFHTKFIIRNLRKKQIDDVLLLKRFFQSNELYGAEIRVRGFSGYLCELLVLRYRSFLNLLKAVKKWKAPVFIDIKKSCNKNEIKNIIKKFNAPLIVIDPVDANRNVAAAVSKKSLMRLMSAAKKFLATHSGRFFEEPKTFSEKIGRMKRTYSYIMEIEKGDVVEDIIWGQVRKFERQFLQHLEKNGFEIAELIDGEEGDKIKVFVRLLKETLDNKKLLLGPAIKLEENVKEFKKAHKKAIFFVKKKRICAYIKRDLRNAADAIRIFFKTAVLPTHIAGKIRLEKYSGNG